MARSSSTTDRTGTNTVRAARRGAELTQAELATRVGVSRQTVVAIESGGYAPSVYLALALARELDRTVENLFAPESAEETSP